MRKKIRVFWDANAQPPKFNDGDQIAHELNIPLKDIERSNKFNEFTFPKRRKFKEAVQLAIDLCNENLIEHLEIVPLKGRGSNKDRSVRDEEIKRMLPKVGGKPDYKWNHECVRFKQAIQHAVGKGRLKTDQGDKATDIQVFQLDSGWTDHQSIGSYAGYKTTNSTSFVEKDWKQTGEDNIKTYDLLGNTQTKAHGTSTAHTMIGNESEDLPSNQDFPTNANGLYKEHLNEGLFPYVSFTPVRIAKKTVFNLNKGQNSPKDMLEGVRYAVKHGADVITMSMGGELIHLGDAYNRAAKHAHRNGVIFVCAAGNSRMADELFDVVRPADSPETIAAAGITPNGGRYLPWEDGCDGEEVDVSAPAAYVYTALKNGPNPEDDLYKFGHGTSQATVHVAAAAALWKHYFKKELEDAWYQQKPGRIVEAFRWGLHSSKTVPKGWSKTDKNDNKGILNAESLIQDQYSPDVFRLNKPIHRKYMNRLISKS